MTVVNILSCTAIGLLRKLGWVHRDVSIGNILGSAKLGDLEYAKKIGDTRSHDVRTASGSRFVIWQGIDRTLQGTIPSPTTI